MTRASVDGGYNDRPDQNGQPHMSDKKRMDGIRWDLVRIIFLAFSISAGYFLYSSGALQDITSIGGFLILVLAFAAVAAAIYRFVVNLKNPERPWE